MSAEVEETDHTVSPCRSRIVGFPRDNSNDFRRGDSPEDADWIGTEK